MNRRPVTHRRALTAAIILLAFLSFVRLDTAAAVARFPRGLLTTVTGFLTQPLHQIASSVRGPEEEDDLPQREELQQNNEHWLQYNRRLEDELRRARQVIAELTLLRESRVIDLKDVPLLPAGVTASRGGATPALTINAGDRDGLRIGLAVAAGADLVGRVTWTGPNTASVGLITAPGTLLDVRILPDAVGPPVRQTVLQIEPVAGEELFTGVAAASDPIELGDLAHLRLADNDLTTDNRWPDEAAGMVVGKVVAVEPDPSDPTLRRIVRIEPRVSLEHLTRVFVLVPGVEIGVEIE